MQLPNIIHLLTRAARTLASAKALDATIIVLGASVAIYHVVSAFIILQAVTQHYITHLAVLLVLLMLFNLRRGGKIKRYVVVSCLVLGIVTTVYMWLGVDRLEGEVEFISNTDFIMGILMAIPFLVAVWLWWGPVIPLMVIVAIVYFFFGHLISGPLTHLYFSPKYVVSILTTSLSSGMFGYLTPISANLVFYFMLFAGVMQGVGVVPSFLELGKILGRVLCGGPAYAALIGSSLFAMVSGSGSGNVAVTGTFTIPAMKETGFRDYEAGAIEGAVSTGGQITPPVMGASAFLIAGFLGVPYIKVIEMAVPGAFFFYLTLFIAITLFSYSRGIKRSVEPVNMKVLLQRFPIFLISLAVLIILLVQRFSVTFSCTVAIVVTLVMALLLVRENRSFTVIAKSFAEGAKLGAQIAMVLAIIGMLAQVAITTGLAPKITAAILSLTGGLLVPSLMLIAVLAIILGMGLPVTAAYLITAVMLIPTLWGLGVEIAASHFFAFYFAVWGAISPPVAPAAMVASRVSGASFWPTGFTAMKFMAVMFMYPFIIALHPSLLHLTALGWGEVGLLGLFLLVSLLTSIAMFGWFFSNVSTLLRGISGAAAISMMTFLLGGGTVALIVALILLAIFILGQISHHRSIAEVA